MIRKNQSTCKLMVLSVLGAFSLCGIFSAEMAQAKSKAKNSDKAENIEPAAAAPARAVSGRGSMEKYGLSGCGLGSMIFKEPKDKVQQILAATTNGTSGNQTFGITTGTLNCETDGVIAKRAEQEVFVTANFETLKRDTAAGNGEALNAFASLLGCDQLQAPSLAKVAQKQYSELFQGASAENPGPVVLKFRELSKVCSPIALNR